MKTQIKVRSFDSSHAPARAGDRRQLVFLALLLLTTTLWQGCSTVGRQLTVKSDPAGANVTIDGENRGTTPLTTKEKIVWSEKEMPHHIIKVDKLPEYGSQSRDVSYTQAQSGDTGKPLTLSFDLDQMQKEFSVDIGCNIPGATVAVNGHEVGPAPLRHSFLFVRTSATEPWSTFIVTVHKDGYTAGLVPGTIETGEAQPYLKTLSIDDAATGKINAELSPVLFVRSPVTELVPTPKGMQAVQRNVLSQVGDIEREPKVGGATKMTDFHAEESAQETRISVMPDGEHFIISLPAGQQNNGKTNTSFNIYNCGKSGRTVMTRGSQLDIEAAVSPDGEWIYFSSDRLKPGQQNIWRIKAAGRGGLTKITDSPSSKIDTYPAVSPDGKHIAFTSYLDGVENAQIWTANSDGTFETQLRDGKQPAWSPDGEHIAFVAADNSGHEKVWVMSADGGNTTQLTSGDSRDVYPAWTPDGKRIVYASDAGLSESGEHNFDIWIMKSDGSENTQLTTNGSYDTRPAVSQDGKHVFFNSNRGAHKTGEAALQIWSIELPAE